MGQTLAYVDTNHPHAATGMGSNTYTYDANGNMVIRVLSTALGMVTYTLAYDAESRLVGISGGGMSATYTYNGDGERVKAEITTGGDTKATAYIGNYFEVSVGDPVQNQSTTPPNCSTSLCIYLPLVMSSLVSIPAGHAWTSYYYAGSSRVAIRVQSNQEGVEDGIFYFLTDHLGSTAITLDAGANQVAELRYSAWGETRYTNGTTPTQHRYTGQLQAEAGLYFYNARFYDSSLGRFAQADLIIPGPGNPLAWDRYTYSINNPVNYNDPDGHFPLLVTAAVGAVVGFVIDAGFQIVPQLWNGTPVTQVDYHWQQGLGAAVAGAIAGGTLGVGTILAAGVESGVAATLITGAAGGVGNMVGNQVGTLVQSAFETGAPMFSVISTEQAANYGYLDPLKAGYDFTSGVVAGSIARQIQITDTRANSPKIIDYQMVLTSKGTTVQVVSKPILNDLGHTLTKPNFQTSMGQSAFYKGITSFSNYGQTFFTTGVDTVVKWIRQQFK